MPDIEHHKTRAYWPSSRQASRCTSPVPPPIRAWLGGRASSVRRVALQLPASLRGQACVRAWLAWVVMISPTEGRRLEAGNRYAARAGGGGRGWSESVSEIYTRPALTSQLPKGPFPCFLVGKGGSFFPATRARRSPRFSALDVAPIRSYSDSPAASRASSRSRRSCVEALWKLSRLTGPAETGKHPEK
jgi:hypothetical protein